MAEKSGFKPFQFDKIKNDKEKTAVGLCKRCGQT